MSSPRRARLAHFRALTRGSRVQPDRFEALVAQTLETLPAEFRRQIDNVAVVVEEQPSPELLREMGLGPGQTLLGLYQGIPLQARAGGYSLVPPDRITLFRGPILERCRGDEQIVREVRRTLLHELGHYFGLRDAELR